MEKKTVQMSAEEYAEYQQMRADKEKRAAAEKRKADIEAYRQLVDDCINTTIPELAHLSEALAQKKRDVYERFNKAIELKQSLFGLREGGQWSHTFTDSSSSMRIKVGCHTLDQYDDTAEAGVELVRRYITSLAGDDEKTRSLVDMVLKLLQKDAKTQQLKASRVLQLDRLANESGNDLFVEGVRIIKDAYQPTESKRYVVAEVKNELGQWVNIPLGMTEV